LVLGSRLVRLIAGIALEELSGRILPTETLFSFATEHTDFSACAVPKTLDALPCAVVQYKKELPLVVSGLLR
jgi:hypothetical protein